MEGEGRGEGVWEEAVQGEKGECKGEELKEGRGREEYGGGKMREEGEMGGRKSAERMKEELKE